MVISAIGTGSSGPTGHIQEWPSHAEAVAMTRMTARMLRGTATEVERCGNVGLGGCTAAEE